MEWKKTIRLLVSIALLAVFIVYVVAHWEELEVIKTISLQAIVLLVLLNIALYIVLGSTLNAFLKLFNISLSPVTFTSLSIITSFGNFFLPMRGGAALRAVYLKRWHKLPLTLFLSALSAQLLFLVNFISLIGAVILPFIPSIPYHLHISALFFLSFLVTLIFIFKPINFSALVPFPWLRERVNFFCDGLNVVSKSKETFLFVSFTYFLVLIISATMLYVELNDLGILTNNNVPITFLECLFFSSIVLLSSIFLITPGALGIREAMLMSVSNLVGINPNDILAASLIDRGATLLTIFIFMPFATALCVSKNKECEASNIPGLKNEAA